MKQLTVITDANLKSACNYIQQQFDAHTWWPKEQPHLAKQEFQIMHNAAVALNVWCEKWLDNGQIRKLASALNTRPSDDMP